MNKVKQSKTLSRLCGSCWFAKEGSYKTKRCINCFSEPGKPGFRQRRSYMQNNNNLARGGSEKILRKKSKRMEHV